MNFGSLECMIQSTKHKTTANLLFAVMHCYSIRNSQKLALANCSQLTMIRYCDATLHSHKGRAIRVQALCSGGLALILCIQRSCVVMFTIRFSKGNDLLLQSIRRENH